MTTFDLNPHSLNHAIPALSEPPNWAHLPIIECGEPLLPIDINRVRAHLLYAEMGIPGAPTTIRLRSSVCERLYQAAALLPEGIALCIFDGYRPLIVQQWLYDTYAAELRQKHPDATEDTIQEMVFQFVASPNADPKCPPPHRTGGAVDLYLVDIATGQMLPMGTEPDATTPDAATDWFEKHPEEPVTTNRRLLFHAMITVGFTNYLGEWWHYDFGNQRWANASGQPEAIYGIPEEEA